MIQYNLPFEVVTGTTTLKIRNKCDYRIVLDCMEALNDVDLDEQARVQCALVIFYENYNELKNECDIILALKEMKRIIDCGDADEDAVAKPRLMDWSHDFNVIAPPVSRILGYDIRFPDKYTHWWTFIGAYMEIGDCTFNSIVTIRSKLLKGEKLEKHERQFYSENKKNIDLPQKLTEQEQLFLNSPW